MGETAKWSGDFTDKKRVFGAIHPDRGIDWQYFEATAKKEGLKLASGADLTYTVPLDTSQTSAKNQEEAPVLTAKLKDSGVTTVMLYAPYTMIGQIFRSATALDYYPEWVFPGYASSDIEVTARINNSQYPEQMEHVFGLGTLQPYVAGLSGDTQVNWFNWYWGPTQGTYAAGPVAAVYNLYAGVSLAGPKLTPETFKQGLFSYPAFGGAASDQVVTFMFGYGRTSGLPVQRVLAGRPRLRHHLVEPDRSRQGQDPLRRRHRQVHVHRRREALLRRAVEEGRAEALRREQRDLPVRHAAGV